MTSEELSELARVALDELKGIDIVALDVRPLTSLMDYMIICTGRSTRHVKSLAEAVSTKAKSLSVKYVRIEGDRNNEWVLVDLADVVVHVMLAATRDFYSLEDLWEPVKELRDARNNPQGTT